MFRAKWAIALTLVTALAQPAWAQDDDLLAPLPVKEKDAPKEKRNKPKKNKAKPKPVQSTVDDDLVPLVQAKTELNIQLATSVKGARLFIDDKEAGTFPTGPKAVTAGEHILQVKRVGYAPLTKKVVAAKGKVTDVTLSIEAVAGVLSVESDLMGAEVWVNDKRVGVTPLRDVEVAPGPVEVRVRKESHRDASEVLTMRAGKDYTLSLTPVAAVAAVTALSDRPSENGLTPRPAFSAPSPLEAPVTQVHSSGPIYERWYFWVGVAAVVAAGVTTAVLVTRPPPGNPLPNKNNYNDWCTGQASCYYWDLPSSGYAGEFSKLR